MCLAIPARVVTVEGDFGIVEVGGIAKEACFQLLDDVKPGEYVIVHAGFAIQRLDENEAEETLALLRQLATLEETGRR